MQRVFVAVEKPLKLLLFEFRNHRRCSVRPTSDITGWLEAGEARCKPVHVDGIAGHGHHINEVIHANGDLLFYFEGLGSHFKSRNVCVFL